MSFLVLSSSIKTIFCTVTVAVCLSEVSDSYHSEFHVLKGTLDIVIIKFVIAIIKCVNIDWALKQPYCNSEH